MTSNTLPAVSIQAAKHPSIKVPTTSVTVGDSSCIQAAKHPSIKVPTIPVTVGDSSCMWLHGKGGLENSSFTC